MSIPGKRRAPEPIRIVIVDDHPLIREGLQKALSTEDDLVVVGYGSDGEQALRLIRELAPDVALLDVNLPGPNGIQITRQLKNRHTRVAVVVLTAYHDRQQVLLVMRAGASAYCGKNIALDDLIAVIRDAAAGYYVVDGQRMTWRELRDWIQTSLQSIVGPYIDDPEHRLLPLSKRETEVLMSVIQGLSNKEIASDFGISQQTVKNHMTAILRKLNVEDRTQAAITALRHGWVRLPDTDAPGC